MDGILELIEESSKSKVLLPIKEIKSIVVDDKGVCFIETSFSDSNGSIGFSVLETFEEIKNKLKKIIL